MEASQKSIPDIANEFIQTRASNLLFPIRVTHGLGNILTKHQYYHSPAARSGYTQSNPDGHLGDFFAKATGAARCYYPTLEENQTTTLDTKRRTEQYLEEQGFNEYLAAYIHNVPAQIRARDMEMVVRLPQVVHAIYALSDEHTAATERIQAYHVLKNDPNFFRQYDEWIKGYFDELKSQDPSIALFVLPDQDQFEAIQKRYEIMLKELEKAVVILTESMEGGTEWQKLVGTRGDITRA